MLYSTNTPSCNPLTYLGRVDSGLALTIFGPVIDVAGTWGKSGKPCSG